MVKNVSLIDSLATFGGTALVDAYQFYAALAPATATEPATADAWLTQPITVHIEWCSPGHRDHQIDVDTTPTPTCTDHTAANLDGERLLVGLGSAAGKCLEWVNQHERAKWTDTWVVAMKTKPHPVSRHILVTRAAREWAVVTGPMAATSDDDRRTLISLGVNPLTWSPWAGKGYTVKQAKNFLDARIPIETAAPWLDLGLNTTRSVRAAQEGRTPDFDLTAWKEAGFTPTQARAWAATGTVTPFLANQFIKEGASVREVATALTQIEDPYIVLDYIYEGIPGTNILLWHTHDVPCDEAAGWESIDIGPKEWLTLGRHAIEHEQNRNRIYGEIPDTLAAEQARKFNYNVAYHWLDNGCHLQYLGDLLASPEFDAVYDLGIGIAMPRFPTGAQASLFSAGNALYLIRLGAVQDWNAAVEFYQHHPWWRSTLAVPGIAKILLDLATEPGFHGSTLLTLDPNKHQQLLAKPAILAEAFEEWRHAHRTWKEANPDSTTPATFSNFLHREFLSDRFLTSEEAGREHHQECYGTSRRYDHAVTQTDDIQRRLRIFFLMISDGI